MNRCLMGAGVLMVLKKALDPLELEMIVSRSLWVLGTQSGSSTRATMVFNHGAIFPAL